MNSRVSWNLPRQFTESTDYVNLGPVRNHPQNVVQKQKNSFQSTQNTPYSRPISAIKPKLPAQNFFSPSNSLLNDDDSENMCPVKLARPQLGAGLLRPPEPDLNISKSPGDQSGPTVLKDKIQPPRAEREPAALVKPTKKQRRKIDKPPPQDYKRILIGSVEHVIRWQKVARTANLSYIYEAIGTLENWSSKGCATLLFLRGDLGQIIQGLYYSVDHALPSFETGDIISMTGRMIGSHKMMVADAREIKTEEKAAVQRLAFLCQRMLNLAAGKPPATNI